MDFAFGWFVILAVAGIIFALYVGLDEDSLMLSFIVWIILVVIGNGISLLISANYTHQDTATESVAISMCDVTKQMGLVSEQFYPAEVGDRVDGTSGEGYFHSSLFGGSGHVNMQPGSAVSMGFKVNGRGSIFQLPYSSISFIEDASATRPSMAIRIKCDATVWGTRVLHLAPAHLRLDSGILMLVQDVVERDAAQLEDQHIITDGLAPIVGDPSYFASATIRLTPELYHQLLG